MDFNKEYFNKHHHGLYKPLNPKNLPNLYLAYKTNLSKVSGGVFNNLKERFINGDKEAVDTLNEIASLADKGKEAIQQEDHDTLNELINKNFDLRARILNISDENKQMVNIARNCGASAKFSGSGGAIIGVYKDDDMLKRLMIKLKQVNARVIKPYIL
jgi:glucuronokinase